AEEPAQDEICERQRDCGRQPRGKQARSQPGQRTAQARQAVRHRFRYAGYRGFDGDLRGGLAHGQRSTSAIRALYQFMNRLMVRNTSMISAMPSIGWPVWLSVVLAMDTTS